jgi:hypothetical protein
MADKYPSMSAYMYVGGHPTIITDPDGRDWIQDENGNYVYDKTITKDTQLKEGQRYIGTKSEIQVYSSENQYQYSFNLNEDGTFSDTKGNKWGVGSEYDPEFKSGNKIISQLDKEQSNHAPVMEGYTYVPHADVGNLMSSYQGTQSILAVLGIAVIPNVDKAPVIGSLGFLAWPAYLMTAWTGTCASARDAYFRSMYEAYSVNGGAEGVYYRDSQVYSKDQVTSYREIIYKNGNGRNYFHLY